MFETLFEKLNDEELLVTCKSQVLIEKSATAKVLDVLIEIDHRRLWIKEGFSSMHDFCIRYLGYSESEANRRIQAARLTQKVEEVKPLLAQGELSLTNLSLLAPVLNEDNAKEILPKVTHKSSRDVEKIINEHFPERKKKKEYFEAEIDEELKGLLEEAKKLAGEKNATLLLKKVLKAYVRPKTAKRTRPENSKAKHTRQVPTQVAREVKKMAEYHCKIFQGEYISDKGVRCNQTAKLEVDHVRPYAFGGSSRDLKNLRCLCKVHNLYFARQYFPKARRLGQIGISRRIDS